MRHHRTHTNGHHSAHHDVRHHHTGRAAPWFVVAAVALIAAIVSSCGGSSNDAGSQADDSVPGSAAPAIDIFDSAFMGACDGVGFAEATAFSQTPNVIHPVLVLAGQGTEMYSRSGAVRDAWTRAWAQENPRAMAEIELVVCAERTSATKVQECTGYQVDGKDTDHVLNLNEVTYDVSLHEARSGVQLAATTVTAREDSCPMFATFTEGETTQEYYSFDDTAIQTFVEPYAAP